MVVAFWSVRTRRRMLTNWFGNSDSSAFSKVARSLMVPVAVSIWLSTVCSVPVASLTASARSHASTDRCRSARIASRTGGSSVSGTVKITEIGRIWVMTTMPFWSPLRTMLPASTWRSPSLPSIGATMRA